MKDLAPKVDHGKSEFQRAAENARAEADRQAAEKARGDMRDKTHDGLGRVKVGEGVSVGPDVRNGNPEVNVRISTDPPAKPKQ